MKNFLNEFKSFAMRGNVVDLAVGVVIGAAFGKIVSSIVADIITPIIGFLVGGVNFTELKLNLGKLTEGVAPVTINYGNFLQTIFDFVIIAFAIFVAIKGLNNLKKAEETKPAEAAPIPEDIKLLTEIRDLLKK
ncbi:MAG: large-conductance mechanosensitive channel protein MscL [Rickettsiales bacterium]|nr:large-conductance mechanosensitive channel protein MscL [Rickettsiales bacterium]